MSGMHVARMWPRFEDGAPVDIGSEALLPGGTGGCKVFRVTVDENGWSVYGFGGRTAVGGVATRVRRPPVLGKDGKAIEPGDAVWGEDGLNWLVTGIRWDKGNHIVEATARGDVKQLKPGWLTHERPPRPVLDRDGVPIEVGDTVYVGDGLAGPYEVVNNHRITTGGVNNIELQTKHEGGFTSMWFKPDSLTHERPDSWERLEEDAGRAHDDCPCAYFGLGRFECERCSVGATEPCNRAMALDIVRRAKALAGVVE